MKVLHIDVCILYSFLYVLDKELLIVSVCHVGIIYWFS